MNEKLTITFANTITLNYTFNDKTYELIIPNNCPINEYFQAVNAFNAQGNKWLEAHLAQQAAQKPLPVHDVHLVQRNPDCDINKTEDCESCQ